MINLMSRTMSPWLLTSSENKVFGSMGVRLKFWFLSVYTGLMADIFGYHRESMDNGAASGDSAACSSRGIAGGYCRGGWPLHPLHRPHFFTFWRPGIYITRSMERSDIVAQPDSPSIPLIDIYARNPHRSEWVPLFNTYIWSDGQASSDLSFEGFLTQVSIHLPDRNMIYVCHKRNFKLPHSSQGCTHDFGNVSKSSLIFKFLEIRLPHWPLWWYNGADYLYNGPSTHHSIHCELRRVQLSFGQNFSQFA